MYIYTEQRYIFDQTICLISPYMSFDTYDCEGWKMTVFSQNRIWEKWANLEVDSRPTAKNLEEGQHILLTEKDSFKKTQQERARYVAGSTWWRTQGKLFERRSLQAAPNQALRHRCNKDLSNEWRSQKRLKNKPGNAVSAWLRIDRQHSKLVYLGNSYWNNLKKERDF